MTSGWSSRFYVANVVCAGDILDDEVGVKEGLVGVDDCLDRGQLEKDQFSSPLYSKTTKCWTHL